MWRRMIEEMHRVHAVKNNKREINVQLKSSTMTVCAPSQGFEFVGAYLRF